MYLTALTESLPRATSSSEGIQLISIVDYMLKEKKTIKSLWKIKIDDDQMSIALEHNHVTEIT